MAKVEISFEEIKEKIQKEIKENYDNHINELCCNYQLVPENISKYFKYLISIIAKLETRIEELEK